MYVWGENNVNIKDKLNECKTKQRSYDLWTNNEYSNNTFDRTLK